MGRFAVEAVGKKRPLAVLPRRLKTDPLTGEREDPVVEIDLELGKRAAGCAICDIPIPPETTRVVMRIWLREPRDMGDGRRQLTQKYYLHPGCITDRVKPEVIRTRMDCYDCGAIPDPGDFGVMYWDHRCFTVSSFAPAPLCGRCAEKPRWRPCANCFIYFPHWMVHKGVGVAEELCDWCSRRLNIPTEEAVEEARTNFEKLRQEIAEHGILGAGDG